MSETSVKTAPSPAPPTPATPSVARARPNWRTYRFLQVLASLRLTVFLFVLSLLLVFLGTVAQIDHGIWTVVGTYFRSFGVWVPWQLLVKFAQVFFGVPRSVSVAGSFPFPGGWLLGSALLVNLLAAHLVRFKLSWKRAGILATHAGLIILMLGELGTGLFAVEQHMTIATGETVDFTDVSKVGRRGNVVELALTTPDPADPKKDLVVVVPDRILRGRVGERISDPELPVDVEVAEFWENSKLVSNGTDHARRAYDGAEFGIVRVGEAAGVDTEAGEDAPSAEVTLFAKGTDQPVGKFFLSLLYYPNILRARYLPGAVEFPPQEFKLDGKTYAVELRPRREYKQYALTLEEFRFDRYPGTQVAKNFSSLVNLQSAGGERRNFKIYMNHPLFHAGETLYQSGVLPGETGTILQVVRNPAWWLPYLSCAVVTTGMLAHFGLSLFGFLQRRSRS